MENKEWREDQKNKYIKSFLEKLQSSDIEKSFKWYITFLYCFMSRTFFISNYEIVIIMYIVEIEMFLQRFLEKFKYKNKDDNNNE